MAGSSAASPPLGTGSVSTVAVTVSSEAAAARAAGGTTGAGASALSAPDFDLAFFFSLPFFFPDLSSDLSAVAPELTSCAEAAPKVMAEPRTATTSVNAKPLIDFDPRLEFIS